MIEENVDRLRHRWTRHHPRLGAVFFGFGTLAALAFLVAGVSAISSGGKASTGLLVSTAFWALASVVNATAVVRQIRIARDPSAADAKLQAIIDQPRDQLIRKARLMFWVIATVLVVAGVVTAVTARPASSHPVQLGVGCLLVVLGVGSVALGEKRLRDPKIYD